MNFLRYPYGKKKALTFSYDDGVQQDIKLAEIFDKNGLKATFNLNSGLFVEEGHVFAPGTIHRRMSEKEVVSLLKNSNHEVASHTCTHPFPSQIPANMLAFEVIEDRKKLEDMFGTIVRGFAYPFGEYDKNVEETLKACGIVYARTVKQTESFNIPQNWLELESTCHHNNPRLMEMGNQFLQMNVNRRAQLFYVWGHSYEFEADNNWHVIEDFASLMAHNDQIWYATNIEIYDYCSSYEKLEFFVDGSRVHNPTALKLWFENEKGLFAVEPNQTVMI